MDMVSLGGPKIPGVKNAVQRPQGRLCDGWHTCYPHPSWGPLYQQGGSDVGAR